MSRKEPLSRHDHIYRSFLQGMVRLFILHRAGQEPVYGEALNRALRRFGYALSPGSLYPLLHTLERQRLLRCRIRIAKGRVRKYYELTEEGRSCLDEVRKELAGLVAEVVFDTPSLPATLPLDALVTRRPER
jgi:DNA-binding PadR family transcriptional regulator